MDAMILAAGLGTRLGEVTRDTPKALVEVGGRTALQRVAEQLAAAGADRIIINVHHHAGQVIEHAAQLRLHGVEIVISHEREAPLETGGALLHAAPLFRGDAPFFLHNVDVLTDADLGHLYEAHAGGGAMATLAVQQRETRRLLLFDDAGLLGRMDGRTGARQQARPSSGHVRGFAFAGIHVLSPAFPALITERGAFSIMECYLRLAAAHRIDAWDISHANWLEIGTPDRLRAARAWFERG